MKPNFLNCFLLLLALCCSENLFARKMNTLVPQDTIAPLHKNIHKSNSSLHPTFLKFSYKALSPQAFSHRRQEIVSDITFDDSYFNMNSAVQQFYDQTTAVQKLSSLGEIYAATQKSLINKTPEHVDAATLKLITGNDLRRQMYSVWRAKLVNASSEEEMNQIMRNGTRELLQTPLRDLSSDFLPFITMLMYEIKIYHYDSNRVRYAQPAAKGIVGPMEMLGAMQSLDRNQVSGVCRDIHELGLRLTRSMYQTYLQETMPENPVNIDDYIFLHAWVTPSSQHITLAVVDPKNPRNMHELDWGRLYKKTDQEGVEIGNNTGTAIRIWQFDPATDATKAVDLIKSQWGYLFDNEILTPNEQLRTNGIYSPNYTSSASYGTTYGKGHQLRISSGRMNAGQSYGMVSLRSATRKAKLGKYFRYEGVMGFQAMLADETERKQFTLPWAQWSRAVTWFNSARYIANFTTTPWRIRNQFSANLFFSPQVELFGAASKFNTSSQEDHDQLFTTGDGNVWTSFGGELKYTHPSNLLNIDLQLTSRNYIIPDDVRLLTPNLIEMLRHSTIRNIGNSVVLRTQIKLLPISIDANFSMEQNQLKAQFIHSNVRVSFADKWSNNYSIGAGVYEQTKGIGYYWYSRNRKWLSGSWYHKKTQSTLAAQCEWIPEADITLGLSFQKYF